MIKTRRFLLIVLIIILVFQLVISFLYLADYVSPADFLSIQTGFGLTTINFLIGIKAVKSSLKKNEKIFIKIVFGSMIARLFLLFSVISLSLIFLDINRNSYIFSVFIFYVFYLIIEVFYLNLLKN